MGRRVVYHHASDLFVSQLDINKYIYPYEILELSTSAAKRVLLRSGLKAKAVCETTGIWSLSTL